ncbi:MULTISPECIES: recombinase family protein [Pseudomonas]|uniref:Recombinase family protein n=2 Tax=Pseudomonas fragariae (ex Marin et al. 2024) TaxID=3080056 RepID=A0ABU5B308_9PSED|nr:MULTISPECIES: recombinase family protein [Pseudomonas]MCW6055799.1 recombinase family protein [Pseudomonas fragi]AVB25319.1 hypothetical protein BKC06_009640 [Pseudomonas syringae pv. syringae]MCF4987248.1 hypothetical protein [Pseudomonas syringae]MCF5031598.1 hypothetical protein [Pseudomonas syringae]MCF5183898.1 hypothetical protein [Pseudomonas syringae]
MTTLNVARIYLRVSTEDQDLQRQEAIIGNARTSNLGLLRGCGLSRKRLGARSDRPELLRMIEDLQPGEVVIAEKADRISRHCSPAPCSLRINLYQRLTSAQAEYVFLGPEIYSNRLELYLACSPQRYLCQL